MFALVLVVLLTTACSLERAPHPVGTFFASRPTDPREKHLANLRQLTNGGENAEAYFAFDGKKLIFQSTRSPFSCDQIFMLQMNGQGVRLLSSGKGRTSCAYFFPDNRHYLYASTHGADPQCPPRPDLSRGYVWPLYPNYDIYLASLDDPTPRPLITSPGYDAEATVSPRGDRIVFTSVRDGDLELYTARLDGSDVRRITHSLGYDGGAFFSPDGEMLVWRASRPRPGREAEEYLKLLRQGLIRPSHLEIYVANADGSNVRQLTANGAANFAPAWHPSGKKIIFASNVHESKSRNFDLYLINVDGTGLERVTFFSGFDGFPHFSPDGRTLAFCSNRFNAKPEETNVFLADWVE